MLTILLALAALAPLSLPERCDDCKPKKLCKTHRVAEEKALERLAPLLASEDSRDRTQALRELAELSDEHENAPSRTVAEQFAKALDDPKLRVRILALELLSDGQHPEVAVEATVKVIEHLEANMWTLVETLMGPNAERGNVGEAMEYIETTMRACRDLRDDRIVDALKSVMRAYPTEMRGEPIMMAGTWSLLELGRYDGVEVVIEQFASKPETERRRNIHEALTDLASELEIDEVPAFDSDLQDEWEAWLKRHRGRFEKKLGKYRGRPLDEDED